MSATGESVGENTKIPFQWQTFADFVGLVGRLFYDDACIVLLDFLAREQRAFLESDLRERLGWREALIQQKLYLLEKHMLLVQDSGVSRNSRSPAYWRISHQIHGAVQYRYQQLVDRLAKLVEDATKQHEFECSKQNCVARYTALEAAGCNRALNDEHPLCSLCGSQLKPSAFEETRHQAKEKRARALRQLYPLHQSLLRVGNMEVPVFRPYTKEEKKGQKLETLEEPKSEQPESVQHSTSTRKISPAPNSAPEPNKQQRPSPVIEASGGEKKLKDNDVKTSSRVIPWFQPVQGSQSETTRNSNTFGNMVRQGANNAPIKMISFGLKPSKPLSSSLSDLNNRLSQNTQNDEPSVVQHVKRPLTGSSTMLRSDISSYSDNSTKPLQNEVEDMELEVSRLGRKIKLSEVTEEIEQSMTDEEYKIYYNATELHI